MSFIPYARQDISQDDIQAVVDVLQSNWLTQGPAIGRFETAVAAYCGAKYAVAVNSATSALHIACLAVGLGRGDVLWTSPNTFVASANCGLYCGAAVDFVDIDPLTYNMSATQLENKLLVTKNTGKLPKVVIPVHFAGQPCEMDKIGALANQYGFTTIEDASHAVGGRYKQGRVGCCQYSDMTVLSFHPVKIITTGEGGMVLTNRRDLYDKLVLLRSHGITRDPDRMEDASRGPWHYEQVGLGFNYRITDIQAALGTSQLQRINDFVARRRVLAGRYATLLKDAPLTLPWQHPDAHSAFHLYVIRLQLTKDGKTRRQVFEALRGRGIGVNVHYIPVHTQPYYRSMDFKHGDFPQAEKYYAEAISLPMYYGLKDAEQEFIVAQLAEVL